MLCLDFITGTTMERIGSCLVIGGPGGIEIKPSLSACKVLSLLGIQALFHSCFCQHVFDQDLLPQNNSSYFSLHCC